jgi:hypothetical protein
MRSTPYHLIRMAIKMGLASEVGAFFSVIDFMSCINLVNRNTTMGADMRPP